MTNPYVSASLGLYLKNKPKGYRGLTQETWVFGKSKAISLSELLAMTVLRTVEFYAN